jgi:uncharacterized protein YbcV (DUF1398 family)
VSKAIDNLQTAQLLAMAGRPKAGGFPYLAETLRRAGVTRNLWFLPACQSLYLTGDGPVVTLGTPLVSGTADVPPFNREALIAALRTDQAGDSTFPEFLGGQLARRRCALRRRFRGAHSRLLRLSGGGIHRGLSRRGGRIGDGRQVRRCRTIPDAVLFCTRRQARLAQTLVVDKPPEAHPPKQLEGDIVVTRVARHFFNAVAVKGFFRVILSYRTPRYYPFDFVVTIFFSSVHWQGSRFFSGSAPVSLPV